MQHRTEPTTAVTNAQAASHGDEGDLYRRHHRDLERAVARVVNAPRELIEDACQTAWAILLRSQPERYAIFGWLRVVAIHEAYRLSAIERRDARLEQLAGDSGDWDEGTAETHSLDTLLEPAKRSASSPACLSASVMISPSWSPATATTRSRRSPAGERGPTSIRRS
jgi:DNA-directed RNA polymerase specialized sigma24 family protein